MLSVLAGTHSALAEPGASPSPVSAVTAVGASPAPVAGLACTAETRKGWASKLAAFLKKPDGKRARAWAEQLCQISPDGTAPCPLTLTEERVADFELISKKHPELIPVLACAVKISESPATEELQELQAQLLDQYKEKFFTYWQQIPGDVKDIAEKFEDFATLAPDSADDVKKRIEILQERLELLEKAPAKIKPEVAAALASIKEEVDSAKKEGITRADESSEVAFKPSAFRSKLKERLTRFTGEDAKRAASLALELIHTEGLSYKLYLKTQSTNWNICTLSGSCRITSVSLPNLSADKCGRYFISGVLDMNGPLWLLNAGASQFKVNAVDLFKAVSITLKRGEDEVRAWPLPEGFIPYKISPDLRSIGYRIILRTDAGRKLADLAFPVREGGMDYSQASVNMTNWISLSGKPSQTVKNNEGLSYQVLLPYTCPKL